MPHSEKHRFTGGMSTLLKKDANVNGDPHPIWIENKDMSAHQPVL